MLKKLFYLKTYDKLEKKNKAWSFFYCAKVTLRAKMTHRVILSLCHSDTYPKIKFLKNFKHFVNVPK